MDLNDIFKIKKPIIGMVHLNPLPGAPLYNSVNGMSEILDKAFYDVERLEKGGVDGLQVENIWDYPYLKGEEIGVETVAALAAATQAIKARTSLPIGVNCHLNGAQAALAVAIATEAKWIRVFEYVNAYISHAGIIEGIGSKVSRMRAALGANDKVGMMCDIQVKHGSHFIVSDRSLETLAHDAATEGAEMLIITGFETGKAPTAERVKSFKESVSLPVLLGSGTAAHNAKELLVYADGAIVGSAFKEDGNWKNPVSLKNTKEFMDKIKELRDEL